MLIKLCAKNLKLNPSLVLVIFKEIILKPETFYVLTINSETNTTLITPSFY